MKGADQAACEAADDGALSEIIERSPHLKSGIPNLAIALRAVCPRERNGRDATQKIAGNGDGEREGGGESRHGDAERRNCGT